MKILLKYLKPYSWLIVLTLLLAAINTGFSLVDPILLGKLVRLAGDYTSTEGNTTEAANGFLPSVIFILIMSITVAMISRIAKNFQDYCLNVVVQKFGASVFTAGLKHAMKLPYQEFEDQRSGETLSVLQKVRTDTEKFINNFVNILFTVLVGIVIVAVFAANISPLLPIVYFGGIAILLVISNLLSKK